MSSPRKIGLFGGTFDPVHLGHLHLANLAREALELDEVRFLPCRISPHKPATPPASGEDRCEMLKLATEELPWAVVDGYELHQPGPSFSYETAEAMARRFPGSRLFWILGADQWDALPRWKNPERLAASVEFITLARGITPAPREGYRMHRVEGSHPASATEIRNHTKHAESDHPWLPPKVAAWIKSRCLYQP